MLCAEDTWSTAIYLVLYCFPSVILARQANGFKAAKFGRLLKRVDSAPICRGSQLGNIRLWVAAVDGDASFVVVNLMTESSGCSRVSSRCSRACTILLHLPNSAPMSAPLPTPVTTVSIDGLSLLASQSRWQPYSDAISRLPSHKTSHDVSWRWILTYSEMEGRN